MTTLNLKVMKLVSEDPISFSVSNEGDIEYIDIYLQSIEESDLGKQVTEILEKVIREQKLDLGERTEGEIIPNRRSIIFKYKVCVQLGEDWNDDKWERRILRIPNV